MAKFLYKSVPEYSREILDILRDNVISEGQVVEVKPLEEYLDNIDTLTFESIREYIKNILTLNDIDSIKQEYLPYLAYILGHVWNNDLDPNYQRFILKNIIQLYKRKGTRFHIHYNLSYFDPNVQIYEPYKDIFILNKSNLNSSHKFASRDYYSWGIYVVKSDFTPNVVKEIIETTRPAGWRTVFEHTNSWSESFEPRPDDNLWNRIQDTPWYTDTYIRELHNYIMWGSLWTDSSILLYEDPTGYFVRDRGKQINLPREFILNNINNASSRKRLFNHVDRWISIDGFGDKGVYVGPSVLSDSKFRIGDLGSESLLWTAEDKKRILFLGSLNSILSDSNSVIGNMDRTDGGSLFKNLVNYKHEDWAKVGPMIPGVSEVFQFGDRKWLEYDRLEVYHKETFSVYLGLKPILWSSTSAPFENKNEPYDSYGGYKFDQRDLDYYFFIHKAFSPKKYSRAIDYNCRLVSGLLPSDDVIALTNYDDLPFKGTLVFNNEFIEYEKIIDYTNWTKFYVDGLELKDSKKTLIENDIEVSFNFEGKVHKFIIDKTVKKSIKFRYFVDDEQLKENIDYYILNKKSELIHIDDITIGRQIDLRTETEDPTNWRLRIHNASINFEYKVLSMIERLEFYEGLDKYFVSINKSYETLPSVTVNVNHSVEFNTILDLEGNRMIILQNSQEVSVMPIDQISTYSSYEIEYNKNTNILNIYDIIKDMNLTVSIGEFGIQNTSTVSVNDIDVCELSLSALSDRIDINFKIGNTNRTIYGPADGTEVYQIFYFENKTRLEKGKDFEVSFLPWTIMLHDKILDKHIMIKYHTTPTIPIKRRFISKLGWGTEDYKNISYGKNFKPRLLVRDDVIEYKYKLHKINDISIYIDKYEYPTMEIFIGWDRISNAEDDPDHHSVYRWDGENWEYISKLVEFERNEEKDFGISIEFSSGQAFLQYDGSKSEIGDKVLIFNHADDIYHKRIYRWTDEGFIYHDTLDNFLLEKERLYGIKKEFLTVDEMKYYLYDDIIEGNHVLIVSQKIMSRRKHIAQLYNQDDRLYNTNSVSFGMFEFLGKQISPPYVENIGKHIYSHVMDKKEINPKKTRFGLQLGKAQPLSGNIFDSLEEKQEVSIAGVGNQYNMALNRSDIMFDASSRNSVGAPVTDACGKYYLEPLQKKLSAYFIGERKLLGNKVYAELIVKYVYRSDFGKMFLSNRNNETRLRTSLDIFTYKGMAPGVSLTTPGMKIKDISRLPQKFVDKQKEFSFTVGDSLLGRTGRNSIVVDSATMKYWSLENVRMVGLEYKWQKTGAIISDITKYKIGSRNVLGNAYFSSIPYSYYFMPIIRLQVLQNVYTNVLELGYSDIVSTAQYVTTGEFEPVATFGNHRLQDVIYEDNKKLEKETKFHVSHSKIGENVIAGATINNFATLNFKNKVNIEFTQSKINSLITDYTNMKIGKRYLLGNAFAFAPVLSEIDLGMYFVGISISEHKEDIKLKIENETTVSPHVLVNSGKKIKWLGMLMIDGDKTHQKGMIASSKKKLKIIDIGDLSNTGYSEIVIKKTSIYPFISSDPRIKLGKINPLGFEIVIIDTYYNLGVYTFDTIPSERIEFHEIEIKNEAKTSNQILTGSNKSIKFLGMLMIYGDKTNDEGIVLNTKSKIKKIDIGNLTNSKYIDSTDKVTSIYSLSIASKNSKLGKRYLLGNSLI